MPTGNDVRRMFLEFFVQKGHRQVHSSSLVPANDPTLLFTNAGMNQFKDVFLGAEKREYTRATTSQKCVRAGGKHNDLENVGFTNRHHTFFEMLGNFSFGDYFKKEVIPYAWELITSKQWYGIDPEKLYVTIFQGENGVQRDAEAYDYWVAAGVRPERIFEMGMKENFWQMGDTGPCGPCSEIHYDMGVASSDKKDPKCAAGECKFPCECGRYVEIWNLVFMQFDRSSDGVLTPLPKPSIDTGAGLERVTAVLQNVVSNYDTDLFIPLIQKAAELTGVSEKKSGEEEKMCAPGSRRDSSGDNLGSKATQHGAASLRVIADHSRAATFLIADGVLPSNEGRGYVLRKIIRRAIRHGRLLGQTQPFLYKMVEAVVKEMNGAYPELNESKERVAKVIDAEERQFDRVLSLGMEKLADAIAEDPRSHGFYERYFQRGALSAYKIAKDVLNHGSRNLRTELIGVSEIVGGPIDSAAASMIETAFLESAFTGKRAFRLYETFGLPEDFIADVCHDEGVPFDKRGFDAARDEEKARARASWKGGSQKTASPVYTKFLEKTYEPVVVGQSEIHGQVVPLYSPSWNIQSEFVGYQQLEVVGATLLLLVQDGTSKPVLNAGEKAEIVLDHTPFYAESGGQVGDRGWLYSADRTVVVAEVEGCYSPVQGVRVHKATLRQPIAVGDNLVAVVNADLRNATRRHHTATHLLHAALRQVLGTHVKQAGSLVSPNYLRFDFSHFAAVADEELQEIEDIANREVLRNDTVQTLEDVPIDVAVSEYHAMALFGEKYGEKVRVLKVADYSTELCGGTHVAATGEIGLIKILKEGSVSSGVRRIEAVAGEQSLRHFRQDHELEGIVSTLVGRSELSPAEALKQELERREEELRKLRKELDQVRMKSAASAVASADDKVREVKGIKVLAHRADNLDRSQLRTLVDNFRNKLGSGVVVIGSVTEGKVAILVGVTKDLTARIQAGKIVGQVAQKVGGSGGGRPDMAEAGGKHPEALDDALKASYAVVEALLA
ncbi:MAG: alanine--tRNA ligase [Acidobacteriota bacterium]|nr:alanine--tRNA ligase [Acidobacteriota bacterium]